MDMNMEPFHTLDADPGGTLQRFNRYIDRMKLYFDLVFRKTDGTAYTPTDKEKKSMTVFRGGDDMKNLFEYVGKVQQGDTFDEAIQKIVTELKKRTNKAVQRNALLTKHPQRRKTFEKWSMEIANAAKLIDFTGYDWKEAAVDAMIMQTSNTKLREKALQENVKYDEFMSLGIVKEQSERGAAQISGASACEEGSRDEEVRKLQNENEKLRKKVHKQGMCSRCGKERHKDGTRCPANGVQCSKCKKKNHYAAVCRTKTKPVRQVSDDEYDSEDEELYRIIEVRKVQDKSITAKLEIGGVNTAEENRSTIKLATDTGVRKTIINKGTWEEIRNHCTLVKTSKGFRPYGTHYRLPIIGRALVTLKAERGATIETWVYVVRNQESSLLGEQDALRLGIVKIDLEGAAEEVKYIEGKNDEVIQKIAYIPKPTEEESMKIAETQKQVDTKMDTLRKKFSKLFSDKTGKFKDDIVKIQYNKDATPVIQARRKIPLAYLDRLKDSLQNMIQEDIIEGPISEEEEGSFVSNLVLREKKDGSGNLRITLDCTDVNKHLYATHEPIPTTEELRHQLNGSDRFSKIDLTNFYHQFEIDEESRKLFCFRTPWGLYRYKRLVQGASPASSEAQRMIRRAVGHLNNLIFIKDDMTIHGCGDEHDNHLEKVMTTLQDKGFTIRPKKCALGQPSVEWFGYKFSKHGMSPDPNKCNVIKSWKSPTNKTEVKSFLQTTQFNAKFLTGNAGERSYPELTKPLRDLTKGNIKFKWGSDEESAFQELKQRLNSERVVVPYDTSKETRLYVDSSHVGTQATVAQKHTVENQEIWRPVNHTSRPWKPHEGRYSQIERESNGILTGMHMNRMYTLGTHIEVVTDHKPLVNIYSNNQKERPIRVDNHRLKLLEFDYEVVYEPGKNTPCDYGSRHPPTKVFTEEEEEEWCIENEKEVFVRRIIEDLVPSAIPHDTLKVETSKDPELQQLQNDITKRKKCRPELKAFRGIFDELSVIDGLILKGYQIIIPKALQADIIAIAHESHPGIDKTVNLIRETCWFPKMHALVTEFVESCRECQAAINTTPPVPLQPNLLPERPWQKVHADFKGPIANQYYMHIIIDQYSKYPEVEILKSTKFEKLKPMLDRVFATHGIPEEFSCDNGPPYNGEEIREYSRAIGMNFNPVTPEDPQCNGFAENFVKTICKLIHTSCAANKDPREQLQNFLLQYRATPHLSTGRTPAEMLMNRRIRTKLPLFHKYEESEENYLARERHDRCRMKQKENFDKRRGAKHKEIKVGDKVLVKQTKSTTKTPYSAQPLIVTEVAGNRITASNGETTRVRDKNQLKRLAERPPHLQPSLRESPKKPSRNGISIDSFPPSNDEFPDLSKVREPATTIFSVDANTTAQMEQLCQNTSRLQEEHANNTFRLQPEMESEMQRLVDSAAAAQLNNVVPLPAQPTCPDDEEAGTEEEQQSEAVDKQGRRLLRSAGKEMTWNPEMGNDRLILEE